MKNKTSKKTSDKKISRKTIFGLIAVVVVFAVVSVAMLPLIHLLSSEHGQQVIIDKMQSFGIFAPLLFVLLQVLQVVIAVIPGGPVPIIGGILFGQWGGLFLSLAGFFLGTVLVYYLVQWIGRPQANRTADLSGVSVAGAAERCPYLSGFIQSKNQADVSVFPDNTGTDTCNSPDCFYGKKFMGGQLYPDDRAGRRDRSAGGSGNLYQAKSGQACCTKASAFR